MMDENIVNIWRIYIPVMAKTIKETLVEKHSQTMDDCGISTIHIKYLMALSWKPMSMVELSEHLCCNKSNTSRAIGYLTSEGFVRDDRDSENSRGYLIYLTDKGESTVERLNSDVENWVRDACKGISDEDMYAVIRIGKKICENTGCMDERIVKLLESRFPSQSK